MKQYGGAEPYLLISQVITAEFPGKDAADCAFSEEELFPIREIVYEDTYQSGAYGTVTVRLKNGTEKKINYEGIEAFF